MDKMVTIIQRCISKDVLGGVLAFCATAPILFAGSALSEQIGWSQSAFFTGLCLSAGFSTLIASWVTRMPVVCTPNAGLITLFVFSMYFGAGHSRESVLIAFTLSGLAILLLSVFRGGEIFLRSIPPFFYPALMVGIGFLLIGIGFREAGVLVDHPVTLIVIGNLTTRSPIIVGIGVIAACLAIGRGYSHPLLIGGSTALLAGGILGVISFDMVLITPMWHFTGHNLVQSFGIFEPEALRFLPTILLIILIETAGVFAALTAILEQDIEYASVKSQRVWLVIGTTGVFSPLLGVPGPTMSPEGLVGGIAGGKTWITGLVAGCLFLISPLVPAFARIFGQGYQIGPDQWLHPLTAPLLIIGGLCCMTFLRRIDWQSPEQYIPAGVICAITPLSFSIVNGLSLGLLVYTAIRIIQGDIRELSPFFLILVPLLMLRYLIL